MTMQAILSIIIAQEQTRKANIWSLLTSAGKHATFHNNLSYFCIVHLIIDLP